MGDGQMDLVVTITGEIQGNGRVMVVDNLANEFEVDATMRPKGSGVPVAGERWLINKRGGFWTLSVVLGAPNPVTVFGDRATMDPTVAQILDVLIQNGLIVDGTEGAVEPVYLNYENDPAGPSVEVEGEEVDSGPITITPQDDGVQPYDPPEAPDTPPEQVEEEEASPGANVAPEFLQPPKEPQKKYSHVTVVTYNQNKEMGPEAAERDLRRLMRTRVDVILLQEVWPDSRDAVFSKIEAEGKWNVHRPAPKAMAMMWRKSTMKFIDSGKTTLVESDGAGTYRPKRYYCWAYLEHRESKMKGTYASTHFDHRVGYSGRYNMDPNLTRFRERLQIEVRDFPRFLRDDHMKRGCVFAGGDFNISFRADINIRLPNMLYSTMRAVGLRCSYEILEMPTRGSRKRGSSLFDQIYHWAPLKGQIKPVYQKIILDGYYSDHRPVMVTYRVRNEQRQPRPGRKP